MANPQLDEMLARTNAALGRMAALTEAYDAIRGEASDPRRRVTACVDGSGALVGLEIDRAAMRLSATELGDLVASTALVAAQRAFAARAKVTEEFTADFAEFVGVGVDNSPQGGNE